MRVLFGEKRKFEKLYSYTYDYLNELNGIHINFQNKNSAFYGKKTIDYLEDLAQKEFIEQEKNKENLLIENINLGENFIYTQDMNNSLCSNFFKKLNFFKFKKISENSLDLELNNGKKLYFFLINF